MPIARNPSLGRSAPDSSKTALLVLDVISDLRHVLDPRLQIPRDCVASESQAATKLALQYFQDVLDADVKASARIRLAAPRKVGRGRAARRAARMRAAHRN
jgi:hypothetical protein